MAEIHKWVDLTEAVVGDIDEELGRAVGEFEPLSHEAGKGAQAWLQKCVAEKVIPYETRLALGEEDEVLGFYALEEIRMKLTGRDSIILRLRRKEAKADIQPASFIAWIARSRVTPSGFGRELFEDAVGTALERGSLALVVQPLDSKTREIWLRYRFMEFESGGGESSGLLWHPVDQPKGGWPS